MNAMKVLDVYYKLFDWNPAAEGESTEYSNGRYYQFVNYYRTVRQVYLNNSSFDS